MFNVIERDTKTVNGSFFYFQFCIQEARQIEGIHVMHYSSKLCDMKLFLFSKLGHINAYTLKILKHLNWLYLLILGYLTVYAL